MRPIKLSMTAFGPYKATEIIDFTELDSHRLFVISGATGAGKTTIFDGICYALYGLASGEDRTDSRAMRSDFADDSVQTGVELVFEVRGRQFRVLRQIPYTKAGNKSETSGRCELVEVTNNGEIPAVDRQIVTEINQKIESLIGFTYAQFSQIIMLPQGEFRKFLTSDTDNKEAILRKIFKTEPYRQLVDRLKVQRDDLKVEWERERQSFDGLIRRIPSAVPHRDSLLFRSLENDQPNIYQIVEGLDNELVYYGNKIKENQKKYEEAYARHTEVQTSYHAAKMINQLFDDLERKENLARQIAEKQPILEQKERSLERAEQAASIEGIELQYAELKKEWLAQKEAVERSKKEAEQAKDSFTTAELEKGRIEERQDERERLQTKLTSLRQYVPVVITLKEKQADLHNMKKSVEILHTDMSSINGRLTEKRNEVSRLANEVEKTEREVENYEQVVDEVNELKTKIALMADYEKLRQKHEAAKQAAEEQALYFNQLKREFFLLEQRWLDNQASLLAHTLQDGKPCPVCGSTHHPTKMGSQEENLSLSKDLVEAERLKLSKHETTYRNQLAASEAVGLQAEEKKRQLDAQKIEATYDELLAVQKGLEERLHQMRQKRSTLTTLKQQWKKGTGEQEHLQIDKEAAERKLVDEQAILGKAQARYEQLVESVPPEYRDAAFLEQQIAALEKAKRELDELFSAVQKRYEESKERLTKAAATEQFSVQALEQLHFRKENAEKQFKGALQLAGFQSMEDYKEAVLTAQERKDLRNAIQEFKQKAHATKEMILSLRQQVEGKAKSDITAIEAMTEELKKEYEMALGNYHASVASEKALSESKGQLLKSSDNLVGLEKKIGKVSELYDLLRGQNRLKLSFERFIQIDYLERIVASANSRLREMSNGQYELIRSDRQEARGKQSGLGLDIYDAYTGQNRDVKTLSGGEKFNASLCLALGMSDVIQSFQGSVSIETMFIDEGFGTLDSESLQKAIDALIDLQRSGRMIGVISHVDELKAAFPAILEVTKSKEGYSKTVFFIK
ncbi:nuclease SbcCD subunit C [Sporosarcina sp. NCCP-2222]|uniref:AAA family ATPase n=1 Tax=Sporosarcina sp. NCCP-2222 TaxID=2935073 RepID=UPI00207DC9DE|nr:SMC family ATPase [Sporosarcina sp. NCCP-2222]GKV54663.1 nuclease SbcCD subunit C [Sporosarcina sp. NCCP-2222]